MGPYLVMEGHKWTVIFPEEVTRLRNAGNTVLQYQFLTHEENALAVSRTRLNISSIGSPHVSPLGKH